MTAQGMLMLSCGKLMRILFSSQVLLFLSNMLLKRGIDRTDGGYRDWSYYCGG
jgi:hypothetical protein